MLVSQAVSGCGSRVVGKSRGGDSVKRQETSGVPVTECDEENRSNDCKAAVEDEVEKRLEMAVSE